MLYNLNLLKQVGEIPFQLLDHHIKGGNPGKGIYHAFGKHRRQYLYYWPAPKDKPQRKSIVLFVHGGGWRVGSPTVHPSVHSFFLEMGFPVVSVAYRLVPFYSYVHMREDMNLALLKTLDIMQHERLPQSEVLITGMSAGGTLAAHLAYNRSELRKIGLNQDVFTGFINFAGPLDMDSMPAFKQVERYAGGKRGSEIWQEANPLTHLQADEKLPALFTHSQTDAIVPFRTAESFYKKYPTQDKIDMFTIPGRTHLDALRFAVDDWETQRVVVAWLESL